MKEPQIFAPKLLFMCYTTVVDSVYYFLLHLSIEEQDAIINIHN